MEANASTLVALPLVFIDDDDDAIAILPKQMISQTIYNNVYYYKMSRNENTVVSIAI